MCFKLLSNKIIREAGKLISASLIINILLISPNLYAKVFMPKDEALKVAFPNADTIEKKSYFLKPEQINDVEELSKTKVGSKLFLLYIGKKDGRDVGYAAIDTHTVRTKTQTIIVVINPDGSLNYTEILAFFEPLEYKLTEGWIDLFKGRKLSDGIKIGYDIPNISGATLSSNATANAVKKVLAIFEVVIRGAN